jgi:S-formylglutathione hydrolase FrmB
VLISNAGIRAYHQGMDESALTRRRLLQFAAAGFGTAGLAACSAPAGPSRAGPPSVEMSSGSFVSTFVQTAPTNWSIAAPVIPGSSGVRYPVALFLHGLGGNNQGIFGALAAQTFLQDHLAAGGTPFAIASVDGGDWWWHRRANGNDPQAMLLSEFLPLLQSRGLDAGRIALLGLSMGGFGALLLASQGTIPGLRAVAAMSPAVWSRYGVGIEGAFDSPADFAAHDVFGLRPKLESLPKRIDCGIDDDLYPTVKDYTSGLPGTVEGGFRPGGHDDAYWRSILPEVVAFLGRNLA